MKIAVVWNYPSRLLDCSFRFEQYLDGFRALGHRPVVVTTRTSAEGGFPGATIELAEDRDAFDDPAFWRRIGAEVALVVTWLGMPATLRAMRAAGTRVVAISDSDGQHGLHAHPRAGFERLMVFADGPGERLRRLRYWLQRQLRDRFRGAPEDLEALESARASDVLVFCNDGVREKFRQFLAHYGARDLDARVAVVPYTIGASFLACPVPETKDDRIVAVGRWDDPQKNAPLLAAAVDLFLAERPGTSVDVFGAGGERWFEPLRTRRPSFVHHGVEHQEVVARALASARIWLGTSRWESGPMSACEALALGATLVGTPIPSYVSYSGAARSGEGGRFGRVAEGATPRALARALAAETAAWEAGERDGRAIAEEWRRRLEPAELCRRLLEPLARDGSPGASDGLVEGL